MRLSDFDYDLPPQLIAQTPVEPRDAARLLVVPRGTSSLQGRHVHDLPDLLQPGDLLVANRSRVLPARVAATLKGGGAAEFLLLKRLAPGRWETLARPARRLRPGDVASIADGLTLEVVAAREEGIREVIVHPDPADADPDADARLLEHGSVPLPPYIRGWLGDPERYQTIYADTEGSAAAPTAGLHFTQALLDRLAAADILLATLVLHVGLDTFRPIGEDDPSTHRMHREWYSVPLAVQQRIAETRANGGRVVAIGTTSVRALEAWAASGEPEGWTDLFIQPGYHFQVVDALLTNFHLPRSTLLMLVSAFAGRDRILAAYAEAIRLQYRFYSFGDAMLIS
ncbi:MAG TPA: tRNA preQ1(34) S-adenosylmethionine ribosyltransferase-isomerase QueA [Chloroflexota bacterium]|jgi:S-adenosylmethionine:tRNA ribosyltransferase-isomerase|nr:tRNA preQ1(34) S-adenosylmethionine ribosyltransferase-isomerase QueA [Chloroflexota bacterium]